MIVEKSYNEVYSIRKGKTMKGGYIFYYGWARGFDFVNGNEDDTIGFLLSFCDMDYESEEQFRSEFRNQLKERNIKVDDVEKLIDKVIKKMDFVPWG